MTEPFSPDSPRPRESPPRLARDGETIVRRVGGRTDDGVYFDGVEEIHPGDPRYAALLPAARANPVEEPEPPENEPDPDTTATLLRHLGLESWPEPPE
ncbi:MAG: hypothetical protein HOQ24_16300 [Mycobacteriaceae bacterium]|nr:hypothetical protein [Mycobacteriaceae bacterium]